MTADAATTDEKTACALAVDARAGRIDRVACTQAIYAFEVLTEDGAIRLDIDAVTIARALRPAPAS